MNDGFATGGVLVVDKPSGPTSHDVVAWARRALGTRTVGHAGTLDPMATGVLVLGIGEGTKLTSYLMGEDKEYETTLALGSETDTLDADGNVVAEAPVPVFDRAKIEHTLRDFVGVYGQVAPAVSAIKQEGVPLHAKVRRGEVVNAPEREVSCERIDVLGIREREIDLRVRCGKGFYVRSLGRDLARALGTRGHLRSLRRTQSGMFDVKEALSGELLRRAREDESERAKVRAAVRPLVQSIESMSKIVIDSAGVRELRCGRPLRYDEPAKHEPIFAIGPGPELVAIVRWSEGTLRVIRGFGPGVS
jgi:tRNA pseudouridine55 synthase